MDKPSALSTRGALLDDGARRLAAAGIEDAGRNAAWLLMEVLGCDRAALLAYPDRPVPPEAARRFAALLARRAAREPLQYVLGYTDFYGLRLRVTPAVLIPRPETEQLAEAALDALRAVPAPRLLDVGTGSGCIALALQHERPDAEVYACDVSPDALAVAAENAERLRLPVRFFRADARDDAAPWPAVLDLVVSNPPYIPPDEAPSLAPEIHDHEPPLALFTPPGDPLAFYRLIARRARPLLRPGGRLFFEIHRDYAGDVAALLQGNGYTGVETRRDLAGHPRIVAGHCP